MKKNHDNRFIYILVVLVIAVVGLIILRSNNIQLFDFAQLKSYITGYDSLDEVASYTDLQLLDAEAVLVDEPEDEAINIGEDYDFPEEFYPYRALLSDEGKNIYNQVYENAMLLNESFALVDSVETEEFEDVMCAVYNDHPELFWLETKYSYGYTRDGNVVSVDLVFNMDKDDIESAKRKFENSVVAVISETKFIETDIEKERYVHDYIINNVTYDENSELNQSAYSALVNGKSVCAGYSRAFQYIMIEIGIPCYYSTGFANNGDHAWNLVMLDGELVNVDVSWDDYEKSGAPHDRRYKYFNLTDKEIEATHERAGLAELIVNN